MYCLSLQLQSLSWGGQAQGRAKGMRDLSLLTRAQTQAPAVEAQDLNPRTAREGPPITSTEPRL